MRRHDLYEPREPREPGEPRDPHRVITPSILYIGTPVVLVSAC